MAALGWADWRIRGGTIAMLLGEWTEDDRQTIARRTRALFAAHQGAILRRTDRLFAGLLAFEWVAALLLAAWVAPRVWPAAARPDFRVALQLGAVFCGVPILMALMRPGRSSTRHVIAVAQMLMSALLVHLSGGRIETNFHVFGSLAFLAFYRDWRVLATASAVFAVNQIVRGPSWPESVYGVSAVGAWRWVEHMGWVVFEDLFLIPACVQGVWEMKETAERQALLEATRARVERTVHERTESLRNQTEALTAVTDRLRASEAEARKLALVASQTENAVVITDALGRIEWVNDGFTRTTEFTMAEVIGRTPGAVLHGPQTDPATIEFMRAQARQGLGFQAEVRNSSKSGRQFWMSVGVQPIRDESGTLVNFIGVNSDITERKRAEAELQRAKEAAEAASRAKSEFLANVSHEIRTPMNGIIGMTELALDTDLNREQREYLEMVQTSADSLLTVINDILDFSKIEAGKLLLDPIGFDLRDMLGETMKALSLRASQKGLELAHEVLPDVPDALVGDPTRLRQVLVNLVGNAIKFTGRGEVVARVELKQTVNGRVGLRFAVTDTGIGIPRDKQRAIFVPFEQADGSTTRLYGGTGLGLAIATRLVALMGGRLGVESEVGRGSTFFFTAWFDVPTEPAHRSPPSDPSDLRDLPVLIVDDNATNRRILQEIMTHWRTRPTVVASGPEALTALKQGVARGNPYRLVLLDVMMPEMDGFALAELVAHDPALSGAVILMLSSAGRQSDAARCRALGVANYLTKPIKQSDLLNAILRVMRPASATPMPAPSNGKSAPPAPSAPSTRRFRVLLAEDNPVNQTLAVRLLEKQGHIVRVVGDGRQALDALASESFDLVLMDIQMPILGGLEAAAVIRDRERQGPPDRRQPLIALTARAMKGDREECLIAGFDDYISKPLRSRELYEVMERCVPVTARPADAPPVDKEALLELFGGDLELLHELVDLFLENGPRLMTRLGAAVAAADALGVSHAAHEIKGSMGHFAASAAVEAAQTLEMLGRSGRLSGASAVFQTLENEMARLLPALAELVPAALIAT